MLLPVSIWKSGVPLKVTDSVRNLREILNVYDALKLGGQGRRQDAGIRRLTDASGKTGASQLRG